MEWFRLFPGLSLLHAARLGFRVRVLVPACLCLLAFAARPDIARLFTDGAPATLRVWLGTPSGIQPLPDPLDAVVVGTTRFLLSGTFSNPREILSVIWSGLVLLTFGIAISRSAATEFCTHSRTGVFSALRFSFRHFAAGLVSTVLTAGIVIAPLLVLFVAGWGTGLATAGSWLVAVFWPVLFLLGLLSVVITIVCLTGWMLSLAAIGTDQCSGADALSKGINYVLSHKLLTAVYLLVVVVISHVATLLARWLIETSMLVVCGRVSERLDHNDGTSSTILAGWMTAIQQVPQAVHLGVFLSGITITYVLLRQAEDGIHLREIDGAVAHTPTDDSVSR
ncbi:MAG: hypothetical protein GY758_35750 [Fuerstiella sp.]|nr:hypothetical protein [Fuerstiella sp.]MCP4783627.1 hypothetical protein [Fuerstiella sp.]